MIQCARCGANNQPTSKYCLACGAPLPAAATPGYGPVPGAQPPSPPPAPAPPPNFPAPGGPPAAAPGAWGAPPFAPPPVAPQASPPPGYGQPLPQPVPVPVEERYRVGSPDGLNPFGATMSPGPQPAFPQSPAPVPGYPKAPPPSPAHASPPYGQPQFAAPAPPPPPGWGVPTGAAQGMPLPVARGQDPYGPTAPPEYSDPARQPPAPAPFPGAGYGQASPPGQARPAGPSRPPPTGRDPEHVEPGAVRALAGFLVSYDQSELGSFWPIYQGQNTLGRKGAAPGLDIEIDHPTTSSRHAVLYASARPARLKVEDIGSTNGTYLGDQPLERARKHELRDGDLVRFGGFSAIVKLV